jgi:vacuolar-type H+-ATPase subunit H
MDEQALQNALAIIDELLASVEAAKKVPLTNRVMLDQDEALDLLERLRDELPEEISQARWLMRDRDKVILQARTEAERILREASLRAEELSRESSITLSARKLAEDIVDQARQVAKDIRVGASDYADGLLLRVQESLTSTLRSVEAARGELRAQVAATREPRAPGDKGAVQGATARRGDSGPAAEAQAAPGGAGKGRPRDGLGD